MRGALLLIVVVGCQGAPAGEDAGPTTAREPCEDHRPLRRALYGDLHVHTGFSFDAASYGNVLTPVDAYRFARGEAVGLAPLDGDGVPTRSTQIDRPLDFVGVTDHAEFLGEVSECTTPGSDSYDTETCVSYRDPDTNGAVLFALKLAVPGAPRFGDVCGPFDTICTEAARARWLAMQLAAEHAYDRTAACAFTSFVAYEYTNTAGVSNLHRNVVFASSIVPELPISMFEAPEPADLWRMLRDQCRSAGTGCDVIVLPHNSNLSNGNLFAPAYPDGMSVDEQRELAALRADMEPVVEVFQHKGDSECRDGFAGYDHEADPLCEHEKLRAVGFEDCGETPGAGGMRLEGCLHRLDFVRNVLKEGFRERARLGVNPYRLAFIGSTDTHNGTPGHVSERGFPGHVGVADDTPAKRLGRGNVTHDGIINNPGGLAAVWAEENSRPAIFAALRRRETFATSGPRIRLRLFGGWSFDEAVCAGDADATAAAGYDGGVPMGGELAPRPGDGAPSFVVWASADETPLERVQIVKGWYTDDGAVHERVFDARAAGQGASVDEATCELQTDGFDEACEVWTDPEFDPAVPAFYYARVVENPTCRWSTRECNALPEGERPAVCTDPAVPRTVRERAWSSPIWYEPE